MYRFEFGLKGNPVSFLLFWLIANIFAFGSTNSGVSKVFSASVRLKAR
ncbi:Uncharacterised protein [Serratia fonticola]|uniref:Uncharacterized protein n=1 Tax=Serratia fonticola TaxID=47917 RepID=A0A4V6KKJ8_SERFO|nr:Uncharacterised protein [Serratia fonticola]